MTIAALEQIRSYYLELLPFNKVLGIDIDLLNYDTGDATVCFPMKPDLIGNSAAGILHGGVTAAVIDLTGGLSALISCARLHETDSPEQLYKRLTASATIDMRVDYLRPGKGAAFVCNSYIIRAGSRIVVARIDLFNDRHQAIATGTGTYLIG
ncbi:MAG: thioesterase family protein [Desulfobacteraceae bacterium]|nr:thioesterase family protein [Desulfobacteraceae bacterium]